MGMWMVTYIWKCGQLQHVFNTKCSCQIVSSKQKMWSAIIGYSYPWYAVTSPVLYFSIVNSISGNSPRQLLTFLWPSCMSRLICDSSVKTTFIHSASNFYTFLPKRTNTAINCSHVDVLWYLLLDLLVIFVFLYLFHSTHDMVTFQSFQKNQQDRW